MSDQLDDFVERLQNKIFEETRAAYGEIGFQRSTFVTDGCGSSTVCGSFAAELALGKTPDELTTVTGTEILAVLGRFPKEDEHCAILAAESLQAALHDYMRRQIDKSASGNPIAKIAHSKGI